MIRADECWCGCGQRVKTPGRSHFRRGHDSKLRKEMRKVCFLLRAIAEATITYVDKKGKVRNV